MNFLFSYLNDVSLLKKLTPPCTSHKSRTLHAVNFVSPFVGHCTPLFNTLSHYSLMHPHKIQCSIVSFFLFSFLSFTIYCTSPVLPFHHSLHHEEQCVNNFSRSAELCFPLLTHVGNGRDTRRKKTRTVKKPHHVCPLHSMCPF